MAKLILTPVQWAAHAVDAGFAGWRVPTCVAVIGGETAGTFDAYTVNVVGKEFRDDGVTPNPAYRSLDVGGGALNTHWWPELSIPEKLDPALNVAEMHRIWKKIFDETQGAWADRVHAAWSTWDVYLNGNYENYLSRAVDAARDIGAI